MKTAIKADLSDMAEIMEHLVKSLPKLTREERIDVAARSRAIFKHCETIDKAVKDEVKDVRKGKEGYVKGEVFRAKLTLVPVHRFDQTAFKAERAELYELFCKDSEDQRITFEAR